MYIHVHYVFGRDDLPAGHVPGIRYCPTSLLVGGLKRHCVMLEKKI